MTYQQAKLNYDAALAAWERSPTDERQAAHDVALAVLQNARRVDAQRVRTDRLYVARELGAK